MPVLDLLASLVEYELDADDTNAITVGVRDTDCDADRWFDYEFAGREKLTVWIADDTGTNVRMLRVESPSDCSDKVSTIIDVAQRYRLSVA